MSISRQGPVINMDTKQELVFKDASRRFTRAQAHRLLKFHGIDHDASAPMDRLLFLIEQHNIPPRFVPPGKMEVDERVVEFPNNVPKLRKMLKDRGIPFKNTDKKVDLIRRLQEHL